MKLLIAPSILSADFGKLNEEIADIEDHADMVHVDVMDGHFVPNITFGPDQVGNMKCKLPMDVHLMISEPGKYVERFAEGVEKAHGRRDDSYLTVHYESEGDMAELIKKIHGLGMKAAIAINPDTPLNSIEALVDDPSLAGKLDMVLLMTVFPGFGGQSFIESVMSKIKELRAKKPELNIQVDGGINEKTYRMAIDAGANILVAGSYVFKAPDRAAAINSLRT